ncbi:MAG: L-rhamnose/proton symporter RhaT [Acidobacteriaceae bacterium]
MPSIVAGIGWHMIGAAAAASFYAPIEKVKKWSWETTWAVAGVFSWVLLPIGVSLFLLPHFGAFYASFSMPLLAKVFLFGCMWGIGNVNYGLTMRYMGMSLGIGVAIGVTLIIGTLVPPIMHGQFAALFTTSSGAYTMAGIGVALVGIAVVTWAGHQKERAQGVTAEDFDLKKGLMLAILCGIFSSGMSFAIDAARPMAATAQHLGVKPLYAALPSYVLIMGGGALVNFAYCFLRLGFVKNISIRRDFSQSSSTILINGCMAAAGGIMWYLQFFFYAWGEASVPARLFFINWMLHMSLYVLFGGLVGLALGEWKGSGRRPVRWLWVGMAVIILAANLIGLGATS